jgi:hypothetical protein
VARFFLFLIRVQWIDRAATSSFLIGISVQTVLLTLALTRTATSPGHGLLLASRAALLTCVTIVLLSAMSSVQNEFRYGTVENVLTGRLPFLGLLGVRAASCAIVASPAILIPFLALVLKYPELLDAHTVTLVVLIYVCLAAIGYQTTLLLSQFAVPAAAVPWLRLGLLIVGMSVIPFPGSETLSVVLPTGGVLAFARAGDGAGWAPLGSFLAAAGGWTVLSWALLRRRTLAKVERNLTDGRVAL